MLMRYHDVDEAIKAWNMGPGNYEKYGRGKSTKDLPAETQGLLRRYHEKYDELTGKQSTYGVPSDTGPGRTAKELHDWAQKRREQRKKEESQSGMGYGTETLAMGNIIRPVPNTAGIRLQINNSFSGDVTMQTASMAGTLFG